MTLLNINSLGPAELIAQYVIQMRKKGHTLPYDDYQVIENWLSANIDADQLLVILDDILPEIYEAGENEKRVPPSLKKVSKKVMKRIHDHLMLQGKSR